MTKSEKTMAEWMPPGAGGVWCGVWDGRVPRLPDTQLQAVKRWIEAGTIAGQELGEGESIDARLDFIQESPAERLKWERICDMETTREIEWCEAWMWLPVTAFEIAEKDRTHAEYVFSMSGREIYEWWYHELSSEEQDRWLKKIGWNETPPEMSPEEWAYYYWHGWELSAAGLVARCIRIDLGLEKPCDAKELTSNATRLLLEAGATWRGLDGFDVPIEYFTGYLAAIQAGNIFLRGVIDLEKRVEELGTLAFTAEQPYRRAQFYAGKRVGQKETRFLVLEAREEAQRKEVELLKARHESERLAGALDLAERLAEEKEKARSDLRLAKMGAEVLGKVDAVKMEILAKIQTTEDAAAAAEVEARGANNAASKKQRGLAPLAWKVEAFKEFEETLKNTPGRRQDDVAADVLQNFKDNRKDLGIGTKTLINLFIEWQKMKRPQTAEKYKAGIEAANAARRGKGKGGKKAPGRKRKKDG